MVNYKEIKEELLNRLRSADILTISQRGVTTTTDTFSGDDVEDTFTLTNSGIKNIREVRISSVVQTPLVDYIYTLTNDDTTNKDIVFTNPPASGTDNIEIDYDYSADGDRIYDDFPKLEISVDKYPRIGFDIISGRTELQSFDRVLYQTELLLTFYAYGLGRNQTEDIITSLRNTLINIRQDLQRLEYIEPRGSSRINPVEGTNDKIFSRSVDFSAPFEFEEL